MWLGNITDMDGMGASLSTAEETSWDSDNGCVYKIYTTSEMSGWGGKIFEGRASHVVGWVEGEKKESCILADKENFKLIETIADICVDLL